MYRLLALIICAFIFISGFSQSSPNNLSEQLRKGLKGFEFNIEEIKETVEKTLEDEELLKQYKEITKQIESGELEKQIQDMLPQTDNGDLKNRMKEAWDILNDLDIESIFNEETLVLGEDSIKLEEFIEDKDELLNRILRDIKSLDNNFKTVYPNIDVMIKSLEDDFSDLKEFQIEKILEKMIETYTTPANDSKTI